MKIWKVKYILFTGKIRVAIVSAQTGSDALKTLSRIFSEATPFSVEEIRIPNVSKVLLTASDFE